MSTSPSTTVGSLAKASSPSNLINLSPIIWNSAVSKSFCLSLVSKKVTALDCMTVHLGWCSVVAMVVMLSCY